MIAEREELCALMLMTTIGVVLSWCGKLTHEETTLLTYIYGAFAASKGISKFKNKDEP